MTDRRTTTLRVSLKKNGFLMEKEGVELLGILSEKATEKLDEGNKNLTEAFAYLNEIRMDSLYTFGGYTSFEAFLREWVDQNKVSRSSAWYFMKALTLWTQGLNRSVEELLEIRGGVYAIRPLLEKGSGAMDRMITELDPQTGTVTSLDSGWEKILTEKYPDAETDTQLIAMWVAENLQAEDTSRSVRAVMRDQKEASGQKTSRVKYRPVRDSTGVVVNFTWTFHPSEGQPVEGIGFPPMNRHPGILRHTLGLLGIQLETE